MRFFSRGGQSRPPSDGRNGPDASGSEPAAQTSGAPTLEVQARPTPLTTERLVQWCEDCGYVFSLSSRGAVEVRLQTVRFSFVLLGDDQSFLLMQCEWHRSLSIERLEEILELCNRWNTDQIFPKAFIRVGDNGLIQVFGEVCAPLTSGVTDKQLDAIIHSSVHECLVFFTVLDDYYPDPLLQAP